jgi:hypothetical protein
VFPDTPYPVTRGSGTRGRSTRGGRATPPPISGLLKAAADEKPPEGWNLLRRDRNGRAFFTDSPARLLPVDVMKVNEACDPPVGSLPHKANREVAGRITKAFEGIEPPGTIVEVGAGAHPVDLPFSHERHIIETDVELVEDHQAEGRSAGDWDHMKEVLAEIDGPVGTVSVYALHYLMNKQFVEDLASTLMKNRGSFMVANLVPVAERLQQQFGDWLANYGLFFALLKDKVTSYWVIGNVDDPAPATRYAASLKKTLDEKEKKSRTK